MNHEQERFLEDLKELEQKSHELEKGVISVSEYKAISSGFGNYPQRGGHTQMLRLRIPGGRLQKHQIRCIIYNCVQNDVPTIKMTTCQSLQLHDISLDAVRKIVPDVMKAGIYTRGGGGNHPRNVMCSPLSGVERGEYFDVLPYAEAASEYLLSFAGRINFPRKLKVGFSNSPKNLTHVTFRDLGFAANQDGTFRVYAAGGLGNPDRERYCIFRIWSIRILCWKKQVCDWCVRFSAASSNMSEGNT